MGDAGRSPGLMASMTDPETHAYTCEYDALGRLIESNDPAGGEMTYVRSEPDIMSFAVAATTALGRTTTIESERFSDGGQRQVTTYPDETELDVTTAADLDCTTITTEKTAVQIDAAVDPRFGTLAPIASEATIDTPGGGPTGTIGNERTVTLSDPANPFTLLSQVDVQTYSGSTTTRTYTNDHRVESIKGKRPIKGGRGRSSYSNDSIRAA